jgi:hypothetical protein
MKRAVIFAFVLTLAAGCAGQSVAVPPQRVVEGAGVGTTVKAEAGNALFGRHYRRCPQNPGGSGILPDGDFSQARFPRVFRDVRRGRSFAPNWTVTRKTIDFVGGYWRGPDGLCSVDLDGELPGAIESGRIATGDGAGYTVTFSLSGNGDCGPTIKTMRLIIRCERGQAASCVLTRA